MRVGPRKLRRLVDLVRGKPVSGALDLLKFQKQPQAANVGKLIRSALANAGQKGGINLEGLVVKGIQVNQGPVMKRFMPRARGSASRILKKMSHMTVVLGEKM